MPESIDWTVTTYAGNRRRQHEAFRALSFREKVSRLEEMGEVAAYFESRRLARTPLVNRERDQVPPRDQTNQATGEGINHD